MLNMTTGYCQLVGINKQCDCLISPEKRLLELNHRQNPKTCHSVSLSFLSCRTVRTVLTAE